MDRDMILNSVQQHKQLCDMTVRATSLHKEINQLYDTAYYDGICDDIETKSQQLHRITNEINNTRVELYKQ